MFRVLMPGAEDLCTLLPSTTIWKWFKFSSVRERRSTLMIKMVMQRKLEILWNGHQNFEWTFVGKFIEQNFKFKMCLHIEFANNVHLLLLMSTPENLLG